MTAEVKRGKGRPPGSPNKLTAELTEWLEADLAGAGKKYVHPVFIMIDMANDRELSPELQLAAADKAAKYLPAPVVNTQEPTSQHTTINQIINVSNEDVVKRLTQLHSALAARVIDVTPEQVPPTDE